MGIANKISGKRGEDIAAAYLQKCGYRIVERNFRTRNGEIDIIALDTTEKPPVLTFVEVKTRSSDAFGTPLEAISPWKLRFLIRTATYYSHIHKNMPEALRIDAVSVLFRAGDEPLIELVKHIS